MTFEEWYTDVFGGHITKEQATDEVRIAYEYYVEAEHLKNENNKLKFLASMQRGNQGVCLKIDGKDMTDIVTLQKELSEKDVVINFLKKELIHKTSFRQVMKRQYRELKQQMKVDNERHTKMYADAVVDNKRELQRLKLETKKVEKELNIEREKYEFLLHFNSHINEIENPFSKEHFNLTKQRELLKNPILYEVLSDIARVQAMKKDLGV